VGTACEDGNTCTIADTCNANHFCTGPFLPNGTSCNDGNGCTISDTCKAGAICSGDSLGAGNACDDGNACTSGETCVDQAGTLLCSGTPSICDDGNPCSQDECDKTTGMCAHPPKNCDDGNPCTQDGCDASSGGCTRTFVAGPCDDGDPCTVNDACADGNCSAGAPRNCDDHVDCTANLCNRSVGGCDFTIPLPGACNDNNPCSSDICGPLGCQHQPIGGACTPADKCLAPICRLGSCGGLPITCSDGNLCTLDLCDHSTGCVFTPLSCDDHDACTVESCNPQTGCAHSVASCDDGIACTIDTCNPQTGCAHEATCDDGNPCTTDVCNVTGCAHLPVPPEPLSIQVSLTPSALFPANHRMVPIAAVVSASNACGGALTIRLDSITSSEPDDAEGSGDGHTRDDIQGATYGSADFSFALRAERAGEGPGRTYRVTYSATDVLGRTASGSAVAVAPVGGGKGPHGTGGGAPAGPNPDEPGVPKSGAGPGRN
jgi:hypothetical protein